MELARNNYPEKKYKLMIATMMESLAHLDFGEHDEAIKTLRKGLSQCGKEWPSLAAVGSIALGIVYEDLGDQDEAVEAFARAEAIVRSNCCDEMLKRDQACLRKISHWLSTGKVLAKLSSLVEWVGTREPDPDLKEMSPWRHDSVPEITRPPSWAQEPEPEEVAGRKITQ